MISPGVARLLSVVTVGMVFSFFQILLGWLDRRLASPVMKQRINSASDRFFAEEEKHWGELEIDRTERVTLPKPKGQSQRGK